MIFLIIIYLLSFWGAYKLINLHFNEFPSDGNPGLGSVFILVTPCINTCASIVFFVIKIVFFVSGFSLKTQKTYVLNKFFKVPIRKIK
jgi:hypothetical protein